MNRHLLILGAGQYGIVAKETAEAIGCFDKISFLDDHNELAIGKISEYGQLSAEYSYGFVAIGNAQLRLELIHKLENSGFTIPVLVNPKAAITPSSQLMKGTIVEAMAVVNSSSIVSIGCIISAGAIINHNSIVSDGCHIDCGAVVASNAIVPAKTVVRYGEVYYPVQNNTDDKKCPAKYSFEDGV